jgi:hypothetical protein
MKVGKKKKNFQTHAQSLKDKSQNHFMNSLQ